MNKWKLTGPDYLVSGNYSVTAFPTEAMNEYVAEMATKLVQFEEQAVLDMFSTQDLVKLRDRLTRAIEERSQS